MITTRTRPDGRHDVVWLRPDGSLIATLAGPFKGSGEAHVAAKEERRRLERAGKGVRR